MFTFYVEWIFQRKKCTSSLFEELLVLKAQKTHRTLNYNLFSHNFNVDIHDKSVEKLLYCFRHFYAIVRFNCVFMPFTGVIVLKYVVLYTVQSRNNSSPFNKKAPTY